MFDQSAHSKMSPVPPSLKRIAPLTDRQVVVLMDNDAAGDAAAAKAHTVLAAAGVDQPVTLVPLPVKDAAQLLQEQGPDALRRSLADRRPLADLVVDPCRETAPRPVGPIRPTNPVPRSPAEHSVGGRADRGRHARGATTPAEPSASVPRPRFVSIVVRGIGGSHRRSWSR